MKKKYYKYTTLSFVLINIWTLYVLFDHILEKPGSFGLLGIYFQFIYTSFTALAVGFILVLARTVLFRKKRGKMLKESFIYVFGGIFSIVVFIVWVVVFMLHLMPMKNMSAIICGLHLIFGMTILCDIYSKKLQFLRSKGDTNNQITT